LRDQQGLLLFQPHIRGSIDDYYKKSKFLGRQSYIEQSGAGSEAVV
jgi:hypothetical protein